MSSGVGPQGNFDATIINPEGPVTEQNPMQTQDVDMGAVTDAAVTDPTADASAIGLQKGILSLLTDINENIQAGGGGGGTPGPQGPQGPQGVPGAQGEPGTPKTAGDAVSIVSDVINVVTGHGTAIYHPPAAEIQIGDSLNWSPGSSPISMAYRTAGVNLTNSLKAGTPIRLDDGYNIPFTGTLMHDAVYQATDGLFYTNVNLRDMDNISTWLSNTTGFFTVYATVSGQSSIITNPVKTNVLLYRENWVSHEQTVALTGAKADNLILVSPNAAAYTQYRDNGVRATAQGVDTITFTCDADPADDLTINIAMP